MTDKRVPVSLEEAMTRLKITPDYNCGCPDDPGDHVHFLSDPGPVLLGAHMPLTEVRRLIETHGIEESGPAATAAGHGLALMDGDDGWLFLATKGGQP